MKKIVLINPASPESFWSLTRSTDFTRRSAIIPPLGLATVAALTPATYHIKIVDDQIERIDMNMECDLVGITGYTVHKARMFELAGHFCARGILTVAGGPYCTSHVEECRQHFDVVIVGEAERIWPKFLRDWEQGNYLERYEETEYIDMASSPIPRWDLIQLDHYTTGMVQTSRGCPYDCEFCDVVSLFGHKIRYKGVEQVIAELKTLSTYRIPDIFFADDNFIGNRAYAKNLLKQVIQFNHSLSKPFRFITQLTLNVAQDEELLDLLREANFFAVFIGIETPKPESLLATNKSHNLKLDMLEAVRRIQSRGIIIFAGMIVGFDTDDQKIFELQRQFLQEAGIMFPMLGLLIAFKGTKLWDRLQQEGRLLPTSEPGDMFFTTNFIPLRMSKQALETNYVSLLNTVYSEDHFRTCFANFINQVDRKKISRNSAPANQLRLRYQRLFFITSGLRIIRYYLFNAPKSKRRLFGFVLKHAFAKGLVGLPLALEALGYFETYNHFVQHHQFDLV
jgi:radical SAM superfamily enzyme YgiQ (UPF0313 family)